MTNKVKTYRVITKTGEIRNNSDHFAKHHVNNLVSYAAYLDKSFPNWKYFNVFDKETEQQIASFTKNKRPTSKQL